MRSVDCLAQAVYYEARSESEDGQRAVAQVVLNRVRHPAWPNSVCGVVYQGALRAGGGCQFTFTCDGSLALRPAGVAWAQARRIAAEALGGRTFAPVGLSTIYHANYVFPAWAPQLVKTATIGAHIFYRLPGLAGAPGAFDNAYAGNEPLPHPVHDHLSPAGGQDGLPAAELASVVPVSAVQARFAARRRRRRPTSRRSRAGRRATCPNPGSSRNMPNRASGATDAPAAVTGR